MSDGMYWAELMEEERDRADAAEAQVRVLTEREERSRSLLWDAHALIHDALITTSVNELWDWHEGPLTAFLIERKSNA